MTNPYRSTVVTEPKRPDPAINNLRSASYRRWGCILIAVSIAVLAWMIAGGMVTYAAPGPTGTKMQNIYLARMLWFGSVSAVLQIVAAGLFLQASRLD